MQAVANQDNMTSRVTSITMISDTFEEERFLAAIVGMFLLPEGGTIHLESKLGDVSLAVKRKGDE